jgi:hypothetical protein
VVLKLLHVALRSVGPIFARFERLYLHAELALRLVAVDVVVAVVSVDHVARLTVLIAELLVVHQRLGPLGLPLLVIRDHPLFQNLSAVCLLANVLVVVDDGGREAEKVAGLGLGRFVLPVFAHSLLDCFRVHIS